MLKILKNKKQLILLFVLILLIFAALFVVIKKRPLIFHNIKTINKIRLFNTEKVVGVYNCDTVPVFDTIGSFVHLRLSLNDNNSGIDNKVLSSVPTDKNILLTIEFRGNYLFYGNNDNVLEDIVNNEYDEKLQKIVQILKACERTIYVRFNPEMDVPVYKQPWQNNTKMYIEAYRKMVLELRTSNPMLRFVWGPAGFMGAEESYPGNDVVDAMSITLNSSYEKLYTRYSLNSSLKDQIHKKMHRLRFFHKPIFIIENTLHFGRHEVYSHINAETDSIAKYKQIAYDEKLWNIADSSKIDGKFVFGLYDPAQLLTSEASVGAEHVFVDFGQVQTGEFMKQIDEVFSRNHDVILTVEPWKDLSKQTDSNLMHTIVSGKYDSIIAKLFTGISNTRQTVYLRFAHEMEIPITRYLWQSSDPVEYIKAFRYFMTYPKTFPPNVKRVWGPAGDRASLDFYPGNDVVDYVSFAIYGIPDINITDPERQESFSTIFYRKAWRFRHIHKPFFITEFGVKGDEAYQTKWLEAAAVVLNENTQVVGINYFNMSDTPGAWGEIKAPDWSITKVSLQRFIDVLQRDNL